MSQQMAAGGCCLSTKFLFSVKTTLVKVKVKQTKTSIHTDVQQMRTVSALRWVGRNMIVISWFIYKRLYPFLPWLWRQLSIRLRCITAYIRPIVGYTFAAIGWRRDHGGRDDAEIIDEDKFTVATSPAEHVCGGQHEAVAGERAAEHACKRPRCEDDGDEDDGDEDEDDGDEDDGDEDEDDGDETTDELYCCYDSTWEAEGHQQDTSKSTRRTAASKDYKFGRFENAARDMQNYRHDYPSQTRLQRWKKPGSDDTPNLKFYTGLTHTLPDGVLIDDFHNNWFGQYDALEYVHTYIQWLFPLQEPGMNNEATPLTKEEIKEFLQNSTAKENLLKSYKLMLDFYGIKLCNEQTGEVQRASNWRERFDNLNNHTHNSLRITRILKCLGTLGYPHYQAPLVKFFLEETLVNRQLPNVKDSVLNYFVFSVLNVRDRRHLIKFAYLNYDCKDDFVWCPKKIQMTWSRAAREGN